MAKKTHYDLIILGAGPAGMAAGVYASRKQLDTLVLSGDVGGQATWSSSIENYLGYILITGTELVQKFEEHLRTFNVELEFDKALRVSQLKSGFKINTESNLEYTSQAVIVATGKSPRMLKVAGEKEFTGKGVTYCATCDAPLFAGMNVVVVGGGNSGLDAAMQLMKICPKVYILECGNALRGDEIVQNQVKAAPNVEIITETLVKEIHGDAFVNGITIKDSISGELRRLDVNGVFIEVGLVPNTDFVKDLLSLNEQGEILVNCAAETKIPGLFAAGDVTVVPEKQIIIAAGDGAKAALGAYSYLVRHPVEMDWSHTKTS